jgi:hypothetical protein
MRDLAAPLHRGAADVQEYTISVSSPECDRTVRLVEPIEDAPVRALVDHLRVKTRGSLGLARYLLAGRFSTRLAGVCSDD